MKALRMFSIPIKGLGIGKHNFEYKIEREFFSYFEDSEIKNGNYSVVVMLSKELRMLELNFRIEGHFKANCDSCLEEISIPTTSEDRLLIKYGSKEQEDENEEVVYIDENEQAINLAPFIYEFIHLSKPLKNVIDCEVNDYENCDTSILDRMSSGDKEEDKDSTWDQLKNIELG